MRNNAIASSRQVFKALDHAVVFWSEEDAAWVADVPDLQSCSAFGDSPAQALAEVEKAMEAWLDIAREESAPPRVEHRHRTAEIRRAWLPAANELHWLAA